MKNVIFGIIFMALVPVLAFARNYGMAGCGLGSVIIKSNGFAQVFAATTNGSFYSQLFGITSGTSNCTTDGVLEATREREAFVDSSKEELMADISAGQGEYLSTLASMYSCEESAIPAFGKVAQSNYETLINMDSASDILTALESKLSENETIVKSCTLN